MAKRVYFVRHGETEGNRDRILQGADDKLSFLGEKQAFQIAQRAQSLTFQKIISSDIVRASHTARAIANATGVEVIYTDLLREVVRPSSMIGMRREDPLFVEFQEKERDHFDDPNWRFEDAENYEDILKRVKQAIAYIEADSSEQLLVVTHGHFLRFMTAYLLQQGRLTPEIWRALSATLIVSNTGLTVFENYETGWCLLTWNDHAHFAE